MSGKAKTAYEVMHETPTNETALALMYIEYERQMLNHMHNKNEAGVERCEGIMHGILIAAKLLGVRDLYGTTITNLRFAIQEERKARGDEHGE